AATISDPAASSASSLVLRPWKNASPSGAVRRSSSETMTRASRNSFQVHMNTSTTIVSTAGRASGMITRHNVLQLDDPSSRAASTNERGTERKKARIQNVPNATDTPDWGRISAQYVSVS